MGSEILIFGNPPQSDLVVLQKAASLRNITLRTSPTVRKYTGEESELPAGCLSYVHCSRESILELLGDQPIGFGERIPIFQCINTPECPDFLTELPIYGVFESPLTYINALSMVNAIHHNTRLIGQNQDLVREIIKYRKQKFQLIQIGAALSRENDLGSLLELILQVSRDIVCADAGSIYIRERNGHGKDFASVLRFKVSQNDSIVLGKSNEFPLQINEYTIAGYVASTGLVLNIEDVDRIDNSKVTYHFGKDFEKKFGYRVKSMLTVPLKNIDNEVVGVLQLMNKKRAKTDQLSNKENVEKRVVPFALSDEDLIGSIAAYAAVSIERADLYESIKKLFEGFLSASIAAIDERDRVTSGHSKRVMGYAVEFMEAASKNPGSPFQELVESEDRKRQFQFAALLHDIGKIGVPEHILTKECRLEHGRFDAIMARMDYIVLLIRNGTDCDWRTVEELESERAFLVKINRAGRINDEEYATLEKLRDKKYSLLDGTKSGFLSDKEFESLSVRAGNLTASEREIINSHALSTFRILSKIPWTTQLEKIPDIACGHHERIDGTGYPHGLKGEQISLESKVLAAIDIYEALVAQDRPYKPKMAPERALDILQQEAKAGHLDHAVVQFFVDQGIYKLYSDS